MKNVDNRHTSEKGFSILEVMISLALTMIGVFSAIHLQITNSTGNQSAANRVKAVWYIQDIAERIRNNPEGGVQGMYAYDSNSFSAGTMCLPAATSCTAEEVANYDLHYWDAMINGSDTAGMFMHSFLPQVQATITHTPATGTYDITINWSDLTHEGQLSQMQTYEVREMIRFFADDQITKYTP